MFKKFKSKIKILKLIKMKLNLLKLNQKMKKQIQKLLNQVKPRKL